MLPKKLKNMNLFNDGLSYVGQINEVVLPTLNRVMEDWRGGGMNAPISADMGMEKMTMEATCGGLMADVIKQFGLLNHDAVGLRFAGAYQSEDSATPKAVEIVVRGRHSSIDMGTAQVGAGTSFKFTSDLSYYKMTIDGEDVIEIDVINMIEKVDGVDRLAPFRKAIGI